MNAVLDATAAEAPPAARRASLGSGLLLIGSVALVGETAIQSVYTPGVMTGLVLLAGVLLAGLALGGARCLPPVWAIGFSALLGVRALAVAPPLDNVVANPRLLVGVLVLAAAAALPALLPLVRAAYTG
ncbi:MAG: hypothetical protein ACRDTF_13270, partial [Pseudonocardiaceae bacterium]